MPDRIDDLYSEKWFTDMERTVELLEKQEAAIRKVNEALKSSATEAKGAKTMEDLAAAQTKVHAASQQAAAGFDDFNTALKQAEALKEKYNGSTKEMVQITLNSARATKTLADAARVQQAAHNASEKAARAEKKALDELSNDYGQLSKAYNEASLRARNYVLVMGENNKVAQQAVKDARALGDQLKKLDAAVGITNRNVGNYKSAFDGLGFSIRNIAGELPNIGISFRTFAQSISNNIGPLTEAIKNARVENAKLSAQGLATTSITKQVIGSIFNWQTAILGLVAVFTAFGPKLIDYIFNTDKATKAAEDAAKAIQKIKEEQTELANAQASSIGKLQTLYEITQDVTLSTQDRTNAVKELQKEFPEYFANMSTEAILAGNATNAYLDLTDALMAKASAQVYQERFNKALGKEIDLQTEITKKQTELNNLRGGSSLTLNPGGRGSTYVVGNNAVDYKAVQLNTEIRELQEQQATAVRDRMGYMEKITESTTTELRLTKEVAKVVKDKKVKGRKIEENEIYETLIAQMKTEALIQKEIADNLDNSLDVRLAAYDKYLTEQIAMAGLQVENEAQMQLGITEWTQKGVKERRKIIDDDAARVKKQRDFELKNMGDVKIPGAISQTAEEAEKERDKEFEKEKRKRQQAYAYVEELADVNSVFTERRIKEIDAEIEAINKRRDAEIEAYKESADFAFATEKEKALKLAAINARANEEEKLANEEKRQELRRDAFIHKAITVAKIAIETALAVVHQLGSGDPYTAFGRAAAVGVLGAAQIAAAIATPLPEFKDGTGPEGAPGGPARVSEEGRELGITKEGKLFLTPGKETIGYLEKGTQIIPHDQTEALLKMYAVGLPSLRDKSGKEYPMDQIMEGAADKIVSAIDRKRFPAQQQKPGWWDKYEYNKTK